MQANNTRGGSPMKRVLIILAIIIILFFALYFYRHYGPLKLTANVDPSWNAGPVFHLLPTVNHSRILIKASFTKALEAPRLKIDGVGQFKGTQTDTKGYFYYFDAPNLKPNTRYSLVIQDADGKNLCDPWPLKTFPAPGDNPKHLRLLIYTGFGGHDAHIEWFNLGPLPLSTRIRLLKRALSFKPHAIVSSGDHIYHDLLYDASSRVQGGSPRSRYHVGEFDRTKPVLGTANEEVLKRAAGPQIAYLYGAACRSIPTFFIMDDHDYFENDIATKEEYGFNIKLLLLAWRSPYFKGGVSFPPDKFMLDLGRTAQKLYLPEFLPDKNRPQNLPATGAPDRARGISECYGTLRYGKLFEGLLYESRRFVTQTGKDAVFTHRRAEKWMIDRMRAEESIHLVHLPAVIYGWSAGKWMEWYPDIRGEDGKLTTAQPKYLWQEGWFLQHNRILKAASAMKRALPLFICGDIHNQAEGRILRSGDLDLSANPIIAVASGSLGTGYRGFPSAFRGMVSEPPTELTVKEGLKPIEKNGFVIVDFTPEKIIIQFFAWRPPDPIEAIDTLEPYHKLELKVKKR
jgi:hypothetical protein